ncbi:hypothetical protein Tco_1407733 [Tanacetum coccineum]
MFQEMIQQQYELERKMKQDVLERESRARVDLLESQKIAEDMRLLTGSPQLWEAQAATMASTIIQTGLLELTEPLIIEGNVTASKPQTLEEAITITQRLMDQVTKHNSEQGTNDHKRKFNDERNTTDNNNYQDNRNNNNRNNDHYQQQNRRQETSRTYNANNWRKPLEFEVGDQVLLKVSPWKGVIRFGKKEVFGQCKSAVPLDENKIDKTLHFVEEPVEIMDREAKSLKRSKIPIVKVYLNLKRGSEFTWECEDHKKAKYPRLFVDGAVERTS